MMLQTKPDDKSANIIFRFDGNGIVDIVFPHFRQQQLLPRLISLMSCLPLGLEVGGGIERPLKAIKSNFLIFVLLLCDFIEELSLKCLKMNELRFESFELRWRFKGC